MDTVSKVLIIAGIGIAGFVIYKLFIDPQRGNNLGKALKQVELEDPQDVAKLKAAGIDVDKLADVLTPKTEKERGKTSKAMHGTSGKFMSYF